jgi:arsenate reductase
MKAKIYHNPACSKSRAALELLRQRGIELEVIEYLETPPDRRTLERLLGKLGLRPSELMRRADPLPSATPVDLGDEESVLSCMLAHPRLIERPIVETESAARLGRPPERVLELFP